ncbi:MAG: family 10 glycosylhydrolase [Limnochordales bacterium]|nr:family 10 glycosylhydrolase [Limnochordales bacterium]
MRSMVTDHRYRRALVLVAVVAMVAVVASLVGVQAQGDEAGMPEQIRAMWVVRTALTSRESIERFVDDAVTHGFNTLIVQVSGRGDAYFRSEIMPPAEELIWAPKDFDPLATVLELAHARGLKVHAWLNDFFVYNLGGSPAWPQHVVNQHPEWITYNYQGISTADPSLAVNRPGDLEGAYVDPGLPEVREWVVSRFVEVVKKYPVDGVHHDFVRYPGRNYGYNPKVREIFKQQYGVDPLDLRQRRTELRNELGTAKVGQLDAAWEKFRRSNVTETVRMVHEAVKAIRPDVLISAAVFADVYTAGSDKAQDWPLWLKEGYIDVAVPMAYNTNTSLVESQIKMAVARKGKGEIWAGLGAYKLLYQVDELVEQTRRALNAGASGVVYFDYASMASMPGYLTDLATKLGFLPQQQPQQSVPATSEAAVGAEDLAVPDGSSTPDEAPATPTMPPASPTEDNTDLSQ